MAKFIVLEGLDGVGKTVTLELLDRTLVKKGFSVLTIKMPPEGLQIAATYMNSHAGTKSHFLFYLSLVKHVSDQIKKTETFDFILCARYIMSTLIYHWAADVNIDINLNQVDLVSPDFTFLLTCNEATRLFRIKERNTNKPGDELEIKNSQLLQRINSLYHSLAIEFRAIPINTTSFTGEQTAEFIASKILSEDQSK